MSMRRLRDGYTHPRHTHAYFGMQGMPMGTFLGLSRLEAHEALTAPPRSYVVPIPEGATTIFVSHQWLSFTHPDPASVQLRRLQSMLRKIVVERAAMELFEEHDWSAFATGVDARKTVSRTHYDAIIADSEHLTAEIFDRGCDDKKNSILSILPFIENMILRLSTAVGQATRRLSRVFLRIVC